MGVLVHVPGDGGEVRGHGGVVHGGSLEAVHRGIDEGRDKGEEIGQDAHRSGDLPVDVLAGDEHAPEPVGELVHELTSRKRFFNSSICLDVPWSMADHIATRKSTFTSASTSRKRRTHQPSVRDFGRRVDVYSKPEKYGLMAKQKQAEECVLYVRVSTTRQAEDGVSIDAQIAKGKANAEFRNLLLPDENIFIDDGVSAKVPLWSRPAAKQMKAFILKQKIKHIFAYRMDRLFRSTIDCLATVEELDEFGVGIHFCESGGQPLDLSSAVGRMLITILAAFGEMERNLISERTRMALQHLKDTGKRFTYDKYGWDVDEDNNLIENEKEQYWIEYIKVRYHEDNISISQIARELNACGVPTKRGGKWSHKQVSRIIERESSDST